MPQTSFRVREPSVCEQPSFSGHVKPAGHGFGASGAGEGVVEVSLEITATPITLGLPKS
jgi:hypothetical protein